ncbi:MAG: 7TM-DISM domain-containing protein, partial [Bacteroidota bacterium]
MRKRLSYLLMGMICAATTLAQDSIPWISLKKIAEEGYYQNHGFTKGPFSIGLIIDQQVSDQEKHFLKINNANINYIYLTDYIKGDTLYKTGDHFPFASRPLHFWDFILHIQKTQKNSDSLLLTLDKSGESLVYNLKVYDHRELDIVKSWELLLYGGVFAFSMIFTVGFTVLGIMKKEKHNYVFAAFILI